MDQNELLRKHPGFNLARVDALLQRLDRLGITPDKYNIRSPYESRERKFESQACDHPHNATAKLTR